MKNKKKLLSMALMFASVLPMTGCAKEMKATCYGLNKYLHSEAYGDTIFKADVAVKNGKFTSVSIEETYTPNVWARVSAADATTLGEGNYLKTKDSNDTEIYFAKYIYVNGQNWTGVLRDDEDSKYKPALHHEYVRYYASSDSNSAEYDFLYYLETTDSGQYKLGDFCNTYFTDVMNDNIKILKNTSTTDTAVLEDSTVKPSFPTGGKLRSVNDETWKKSADALCAYLVGKNFNFVERVTDADLDTHNTIKADGVIWYYNQKLSKLGDDQPAKTVKAIEENDSNWEAITGCTVTAIAYDSMVCYLDGIDQAYASVEYDSIK